VTGDGRRFRRGRTGLIAAVSLAFAAAASVALFGSRPDPETPVTATVQSRPTLLLLTSLPIVFGERFSIDGHGSPALDALERHYRVVPISVTDTDSLRHGGLLLMAHPLAQPAEALVDLDSWVRGGGRVLLLADPALDWHSERPFGDRLRPPPMFADTGLLGHWGVSLRSPEERGPKLRELGARQILTASPGELSGRCPISPDGLVARCAVGAGRATIVADADFLDVGGLGGPTEHNLEALIAELATLSR